MKKKILAVATVIGMTAGSLFASGASATYVGADDNATEPPPFRNHVGKYLNFREEDGRFLIPFKSGKECISVSDNFVIVPYNAIKKVQWGKDDLRVTVHDDKSRCTYAVQVPIRSLKGKTLNRSGKALNLPILGKVGGPVIDKGKATFPVFGNDKKDGIITIWHLDTENDNAELNDNDDNDNVGFTGKSSNDDLNWNKVLPPQAQ